MKSNIVVVGSLNMDLVVRVSHLPSPGETLTGEDFRMIPGGKGANQAVAATRLGANVAMVGCVGDDPFARRLREALRREGISTEHISPLSGTTSGMALVTVGDNGQNTIVLSPGANMRVSPDQVKAAENLVRDCDVLLLQLEVPPETVEVAARLAQSYNSRVILNPAPAKDVGVELLRLVDYLVPNEIEAAALTGLEVKDAMSAEDAAAALQDMCGGAVIVLTMGSRGALMLQNEKPTWVPAPSVPVVDTTAAGDAFVAAMAVALAEGKSDLDAVRWGCVAGSLTATKLGAQPSLPTRRTLRDFVSLQGLPS